MPRTDSTEDKRWYSLHVHWVIGAWWILCALGRKLNVIDELEWMKMKSISKNLFFFLQTYSQQQCPQHTILSFSAEFNFTAALLSMPLKTPQEDLVCHYYHRLWLWTWTADWRRSCRAPCSADNCASHPRWPWQTLPQQIPLGYHDSDPGTCLP